MTIISNFQCLVKLTTVFSNINAIKELNKFNQSLYSGAIGNWEKCLDTWLRRFKQVSTFHISVHWIAAIFLLCFPLYGYFVLDEMVPFFDLVIPFADESTARGYLVTLVFQFILCIYAISIMYSVDYVFILTLFSGAAIIDLVEQDCKALTIAIRNSIGGLADIGHINDLLIIAIRRNQFMRMLVFPFVYIFNGDINLISF